MNLRRSRPVLAVAASALVFSACGSSPPPSKELAEEMIDTLDVTDEVKACMKDELESFELTEEEAAGFTDLDDVATKASEGQAQALQIIERFEEALGSCTEPG